MKKISGRDYLLLAAVAVLIGVLSLGSGRGKGKNIPLDDRHRTVYDAIKEGRSRAESELICATCHSKSSIPLPKEHPPKEECLICHLLANAPSPSPSHKGRGA
ncbi:MAG: cytochrome C [Geobacteraceae bacterium GWC2_58_44]|nr:MAG: cytochrome C [Geobacteraceae bacterium GWC2_58_44]HBG05247.1 cytochrome C [Geobacter sp.]